MSYSKNIKRSLNKCIDEISASSSLYCQSEADFTRNRKLSFSSVMKAVLCFGGKSLSNVNGFTAHYNGLSIREHDNGLFYVGFKGMKYLFNNSKIKVGFDGLCYYDEDKQEDIYVDGNWSFEFRYKRVDVQRKIAPGGVYSRYGNTYEIIDFVLSPLGIYIQGEGISSENLSPEQLEKAVKDQMMSSSSDIRIEMKDGTVYTNKDTEAIWSGFGYDSEKEQVNSDLEVYFTNIINLDDIETIIIGSYVVYEA